MTERTSAAARPPRAWTVARLGAMTAGLAVPIAVAGLASGAAAPVAAVPAAQDATPAAVAAPPPPPDDIAATVSACLAAGVDFSDCVDATVAALVPAIEASVPAEETGATEEPPPPPVPVIVVPPLPPLPLPLPPVLGGGVEDDEATEDENG